jgi:hypothetical protein
MNKDPFLSSDYKPHQNTKKEIEELHSNGNSLDDIHLKHANMENANLVHVSMSNADLTRSNFSNASMYGANLEGTNLFKTIFERANLKSANLQNCNLLGADFSNTKLNNVNWGDSHKVINEKEAEEAHSTGDHALAKEKYKEAEDVYRSLKISLQTQTLGDDVSKFFEREMICKRKQIPLLSPFRLISKIAHLTTGYGEKVVNIFYTIIGIIITCAFAFGFAGVSYQSHVLGFFGDVEYFGSMLNVIGNLIYFSVVVFSTVGFGDIAPINLFGKSIVIFEGLIGSIIMSILIIALYRKLMDR